MTNLECNSPEYGSWLSMKNRCRYHYAYIGVKICDEWQDYENFLADMGRKPNPNYSIDRIDSKGSYEPTNCRWANATEQIRNSKQTKLTITKAREAIRLFDLGIKQGVIAEKLGVARTTIQAIIGGRTWRDA